MTEDHQPPQRSPQGDPQARRKALARQAGRFVAEGEDLLEAADAAGWHASARYAAAGSGLRASRSRRTCWRRSRSSARARARSASTRSAGRRRPARCASRCGACGTRATSARSSRSALAFGAVERRARPRQRRPVRAQGGARVDGRAVLRAGRARAQRRRAARAGASRSSRARACRWASSTPTGELTLVVGAEREGLPRRRVAACDDVAHIPIAHATR